MSEIVDSKSQSLGGYLLITAMTFALRMSKLVMSLGVVVAGLLYWKQDSMLYFPGMSEGPVLNVLFFLRRLTCVM
jgi:hypothetical protein